MPAQLLEEIHLVFRGETVEKLILKKGKLCTVCAHRERAAIDLALARGVAVSALARRYDLGVDSIYRHRRAHLTAQLRAKLIAGPDIEIDLARLRESESQSLLANLVALRHRLFASLDVAEECGDSNIVCRVTGQPRADGRASRRSRR
jgi:transposase-like protein